MPYGSGDCYLGATHANDWNMPSPTPSAADPSTTNANFYQEFNQGSGGHRSRVVWGYRWLGTATCAAGYKAVTGGTDCARLGGYSFLQNGVMLSSFPTADGQGWTVSCCGANPTGAAAGGTRPSALAWVGCMLEDGPP